MREEIAASFVSDVLLPCFFNWRAAETRNLKLNLMQAYKTVRHIKRKEEKWWRLCISQHLMVAISWQAMISGQDVRSPSLTFWLVPAMMSHLVKPGPELRQIVFQVHCGSLNLWLVSFLVNMIIANMIIGACLRTFWVRINWKLSPFV